MKLAFGIKKIQKFLSIIAIACSILFISACNDTSAKDITLDNYGKFIELKSGTNGGAGGWNFWISYCSVRIQKKSSNSSLENIDITYKFTLFDARETIRIEETFSEFSMNFDNDYVNTFNFSFDHSYGNDLPDLFTTIQVLAISGSGILIRSTKLLEYIGIASFFILAFGILLIFPIRAIIFSKKFSKIRNEMRYEEVISILGTPYKESSADGITTCTWRRRVLRNWTKSYIVTFQYGMVLLTQKL